MQPAWTYTLRDVGGSAAGVLLFPCVLIAPGYLVAQLTDLAKFRSRSGPEQLAWAVLLSFAVGTLCTVGAVWLAGTIGGACALVAVGLCAGFLRLRSGSSSRQTSRACLPYLALAILICAFSIFSLVDVGIHDRLYMSVTAYDHALRTAFVDAVLRAGVPPASPVYWPGHNAPMRYYYFWYVVCAAVAKLGHISARQALIASSVWSVFGVCASLAVFARYILDWRGEVLRRRWWIAIGLLTVTGLDGLIAVIAYLAGGIVARDTEWWSLDQVSSWADTFLWVPHHAAALVCAVLCLVLVDLGSGHARRKNRWLCGVLAGIAFASAFGTSTYIAIGLALVVATWFIARIFGPDRESAIETHGALFLIAALSLAPYLFSLLKPQPGVRVQTHSVLQLGVRELLPPTVLLRAPGIQAIGVRHPHLANEISAGLLLVPSYFLELGFFAVALISLQRRSAKSQGEKRLLFVTWTGLAVVTVLRSSVIAMNDYAVRASLIPQFCLLFAGVLALERSRELTRIFLLVTLVIGVCGSGYQVVLLRTYLPLHDRPSYAEYRGLAHQNYVLRDGDDELRRQIPANARVQFSVPNRSYTGLAQQMNIGRQMIVDDDHCNDSFGGEQTPCSALQASFARLFHQTQVLSAVESAALCRSTGAQYLVAAAWDDVWKQKESWVWTLPIVVQRPELRVLSCTLPERSK